MFYEVYEATMRFLRADFKVSKVSEYGDRQQAHIRGPQVPGWSDDCHQTIHTNSFPIFLIIKSICSVYLFSFCKKFQVNSFIYVCKFPICPHFNEDIITLNAEY